MSEALNDVSLAAGANDIARATAVARSALNLLFNVGFVFKGREELEIEDPGWNYWWEQYRISPSTELLLAGRPIGGGAPGGPTSQPGLVFKSFFSGKKIAKPLEDELDRVFSDTTSTTANYYWDRHRAASFKLFEHPISSFAMLGRVSTYKKAFKHGFGPEYCTLAAIFHIYTELFEKDPAYIEELALDLVLILNASIRSKWEALDEDDRDDLLSESQPWNEVFKRLPGFFALVSHGVLPYVQNYTAFQGSNIGAIVSGIMGADGDPNSITQFLKIARDIDARGIGQTDSSHLNAVISDVAAHLRAHNSYYTGQYIRYLLQRTGATSLSSLFEGIIKVYRDGIESTLDLPVGIELESALRLDRVYSTGRAILIPVADEIRLRNGRFIKDAFDEITKKGTKPVAIETPANGFVVEAIPATCRFDWPPILVDLDPELSATKIEES